MNPIERIGRLPSSDFKHYFETWCLNTSHHDLSREHVCVIASVASKCSTAVEFGVRRGVSSVSLAYGLSSSKSKHRKLTSYDIQEPSFKWSQFENYCKDAKVEIEFHIENSRKIAIPRTDILFIDSFHSYSHFMEEIRIHESKASKFIIMHDSSKTGTYGLKDQDSGYDQDHDYHKYDKQGMYNAAIDFERKYGHRWEVFYHSNVGEGLTVFITKNKDMHFDSSWLDSVKNFPRLRS